LEKDMVFHGIKKYKEDFYPDHTIKISACGILIVHLMIKEIFNHLIHLNIIKDMLKM
jgi:hypothetical protein